MKIGIIRSYELERSKGEVSDLILAIRKSGNIPYNIYIDMMGVEMGPKGMKPVQMVGRSGKAEVKADGAILRNIGIIKDYEQFGHRIWCVKALEMYGIPVMNRLLPWLTASDKFATLIKLSDAGLPVPETVSSENFFIGYDASKRFRSVIVKQLRSSMGYGVFKIDDPDIAMQVFSYLVNLNKPVYVQKYLEKKNRGDYRVVVVGGKVLGAEFRRGSSWKSNIAQGASARKAKIDGELGELAIKAAEVLELDYVGVDIAETKDGYFILETNPTLSWQAFKKVTGINPATHIVQRLVEKIKSG